MTGHMYFYVIPCLQSDYFELYKGPLVPARHKRTESNAQYYPRKYFHCATSPPHSSDRHAFTGKLASAKHNTLKNSKKM